jgi:hypothetical protein
MIQFADDLLGREGRLVSALRRHYGAQIKNNSALAAWMGELGREREVKMAL